MRNAYKIFVGQCEAKNTQLTKEENVKMNVMRKKCEVVDWINIARDKVP
jgi:hypothetical protein